MKKEKNKEIFDVDAQLDAAFGKEGTPERLAAEERADAFLPVRLSRMPVRRLISRRKNWLPESEPTSRIFRVLKRGAQNPRSPLSTALSPLSA